MESDLPLTISWLDSIDSTQKYLLEGLKAKTLSAPICIATSQQTAGLGSRGNAWEGLDGNLFFSFACQRDNLPSDLKLESTSIYFTYLLKEVLSQYGSEVWLKWPNDFYLNNKKIGGAITNLVGENVVCGIGLNMKHAPEGFSTLDISISQELLLESYFSLLNNHPSWKQIFSKYALEFVKSKNYFTHNENKKISLENAILLDDGSIECEGKRMFSLR